MNVHFILLQTVSVLAITTLRSATADPCLQDYGKCDSLNGLCWATSNTTHFCTCKAGFKQDTNAKTHKCIDIDECVEEKPCDSNAICQNTYGGHICHCKCGYIKDYTGQRCLDPDLISGLCNLPSSCYHRFYWWRGSVVFHVYYAERDYITDVESLDYRSEKSYHASKKCKCANGYRMNKCGYCEDVDECAEAKHDCVGSGAKCVNTEGSYYCECDNNYTLGPCRRQCYPQESQIPLICEQPDLSSLSSAGRANQSSRHTPVPLQNWRTCATGVAVGNTTLESFDLDGDGKNDVTLTWVCDAGRRSVLKKYSEDEAKWDEWSCWSACKATCWGGVQTRTRTCLHGLPGLPGCPGVGSESRECYFGTKCPFRVRKDATKLTVDETADLVQAMRKYKADMTVKGYHNAASAHGWPYQCGRQNCCPHGAKMKFLAWHRTIVLNFEEGISRFLQNKTLGLPYWNWLARNRNPPALAWQRFAADRQANPFANMTVRIDLQGPMRTIQRDQVFMPPLNFAHDTWRDVARRLMKTHSMHEFAESLETAHGGPHVSACGNGRQTAKCLISLAGIRYSGFDPLFILHHTNVDRLWAIAQKKAADTKTTTWSPQTALEPMEDRGDWGRHHMPFGNKTLNAFPIVQAVNKMGDSYYYKELTGITYDFLGGEGLPGNETTFLAPQRGLARRRGGTEVLFISHYLQNIVGDDAIYVNYYLVNGGSTPCSELTEETRVGRNILLPTDRPYNNSVPSLIVMEKVGFANLDRDWEVQACYTNIPRCTTNCTAAMNPGLDTLPSPGLVHHLPNQPADVYKFIWSPGKRMPNWQINLSGGNQWIFFYGTRSGNVVQVFTPQSWINCNSTSSTPLRCSLASGGKACMLPVGLYYLMDRDEAFCRQGLKMIVSSKI